MTFERVKQLLKCEKTCVLRQDTSDCCRDECGCQCCDLIQETADVLNAYDMAIDCVEFTNIIVCQIVDLMIKLNIQDVDELHQYLKRLNGEAYEEDNTN